jgi:hypothetical protein
MQKPIEGGALLREINAKPYSNKHKKFDLLMIRQTGNVRHLYCHIYNS